MPLRQARLLNELRQKALVSDTDRLLALARDLDANLESMSAPERLHKADEIQKLAKSVRDKMSYAVPAPIRRPDPFTVTE